KPKPAKPATRNENRPSSRSSASSRALWASPGSTCAAFRTSLPNGCSSRSPTTAAGCIASTTPDPSRQTHFIQTRNSNRIRQAASKEDTQSQADEFLFQSGVLQRAELLVGWLAEGLV